MKALSDSPSLRPILLVEDNPADIDLTKRAFAKHGFSNCLDVACDGEEALKWIPRWEGGVIMPAVILLDLKLPKVSGLEVLQQIKQHPQLRVIPIVMLTTSREDVDVRMAYESGANSYIVKPVNFDAFSQAIGQIEQYWCRLNHPPFNSSALRLTGF